MIQRPCIGCGELINTGSRCADCRIPRTNPADRPSAPQRGYDSRWRALSKRLRKRSPFCELCGSTTDLVADHISAG